MLTLTTLRGLANGTSYQRGQAYFRQGAVGKITPEGRTFAARVSGSSRYRVSLEIAADGQLQFTCSCPYDYGGICKHAVALGLAVLEEFDLATLPAPPPTVAEIWPQVTTEQKLDFLFRLLHRDGTAARAFITHVTKPAPKGRKQPDAVPALAQALAALKFDDDTLVEPNEDYYDFDDYLFEEAEKLINDLLRPVAEDLTSRLRAGQVAATLADWAATGTALYRVKKPAADDFQLFGRDYPLHLLHAWETQLTEAGWLAQLAIAPLPKPERKAVEAWLTTELTAKKARWPDLPAAWEPVLLALATADEKLAAHLPPLLKKAVWLSATTRAAVLLQVARTTHDDALWVSVAEAQVSTDLVVAQQLLHFYRNAADAVNHRRTATHALAAFPEELSAYVLTHFSATNGQELYRDALRYRCRTTASLADYEALAALLTPAERRKFADEVCAAWAPTEAHARFAADLLHRQSRPDDLLHYLNRLDWLALPDATPALLRLLVPLRPDACLDAVAARIEAAFNAPASRPSQHPRGTALYSQVIAWLTALHRQAELRPQIGAIVEFLFEQYPTLNLLKRALREAQLTEDTATPPPPDPAPRRRGRPAKLR